MSSTKNEKLLDEKQSLNEELITEGERSTRARTTLQNHNPNENQQRRKAKHIKQTFGRLFKYTLKYKCLVLFANLGMLVSSGGMVLLPMLCGIIIDHIKNEEQLTMDAINFLILTVSMAIFSAIRGFCFNLIGEKIVRDLRIELFNKLVQKDIAYYDKNKTGQLISRLTSDVSTVQSAASDNISILLRNLIQFFGSLVFLWVISWQLTTFIIVVTPIISFVIIAIIKVMKRLKKQYQNTLAFANSLANQVFGNIRVVRSFSNQINQYQNYSVLLDKTYTTGRKRALIYSIMLLTMTLFGNFLILSILYFGGRLTIAGDLSIGDLTSFVLYTVTLTVGFSSVSGIINQIVSALGVCETLFQIMDDPVTIISGPQKAELQSDIIVQFINVTFAYPSKPDVKVLKNFNLKIKKGESIALVGSSGSGKSSVISLILRFYDIEEGKILIGGKDIKSINLDSLRKQIGFVSQQPTLFSGSLRQNIQYGLLDDQRSDEKVYKALQIANAKAFALNPQTFPQKLDTLVGERGVKLSGGQKQRIAIARCVIKDPKILIFDEATSALDAESQSLVQKAIDTLVELKQNTMIVVAHRLSTIINCDRIAVIKDGEVVESGKHWDLLKNNGVYKALVQKQISGYSNMMKETEEKK